MPAKLLLADDSITVQRVIALTFQGEGIDVIAVGDGDQAVEIIERERPQVVLADLSMPGRDGYAVAEHVKRSPSLAADTRVILLTGAFEPVEERRSQALGIDGVLAKPFEPQVAIALVKRLLAAPPAVPQGEAVAAVPAVASSGGVMAQAGGSMAAGSESEEPVSAAAGYPFEPQASEPPSSLALDDYFKRLDEALATAGLGASSATPAIARPLVRDAQTPQLTVPSATPAAPDAETMTMARPMLPRSPQPAPEPTQVVDAGETVSASAAVADVVAEPAAPVGTPSATEDEAEPTFVEATSEATSGAAAPAAAEAPGPVEALEKPGAADAPEPPSAAPPDTSIVFAEAEPASTVEETVLQESPASGVALVDAFSALLAAEEGRGEPTLFVPAPAAVASVPAPAAPPVDLDALADQVARKVLAQLTDARIEAIVSERVLEVAERLVREEIERIKAEAGD